MFSCKPYKIVQLEISNLVACLKYSGSDNHVITFKSHSVRFPMVVSIIHTLF